ncbi:MAG: hypothetical protein ACKOZW_06855, partial [Cyanobium sp.]
RVVLAGLIAAAAALAVAFVLRAMIATTPERPTAYSLYWGTVLMGVSGLIAGMAVEAVRQLQSRCPDPDYRRENRRRRGGG